jgi:hypothetical protein
VLAFADGRRIGWSIHNTYAEADRAGFDLLCRWFDPESYAVVKI